ncbi:hypothetical protein [Brucella abortus]|uniref:hypothetical protein n=1 Tax=Brucella abortus TaxID=235 RepID=UPI0009AF270A
MAGKLVARIINGKVERNGHLFSTIAGRPRSRAPIKLPDYLGRLHEYMGSIIFQCEMRTRWRGS